MNATYVDNQGLFSEYYLRELLPERDEWQVDYTDTRNALADLLQNKLSALPNHNEAQTETEFIQPALELLGWEFETQITFRRRGRNEIPDYALFVSQDDKESAQSTLSSRNEPCGPEYLEKTAALGEAKYWERPLEERQADTARDRGRDRRRSPHFQIIDYIDDADVRWGILTNGRIWRLYFGGGDTAEILYYEADLKAILDSSDPDAFRRFVLFFSADVFRPDDEGLCLLDHLREESQQYAEAVEERLKERVFDSVVPVLAGGFLRYMRQEQGIEIGADDRKALDKIYNGTLLLLYRLFFLLYAESRELIAVGESTGYERTSLNVLKQEIFETVRDGVSLGARSTDWWDDLTNLFDVINGGDSGLNVPRYNGGLFHPEGLDDPDIGPAARFLEQNAIADRDLASALMRLTRDVESATSFDQPAFIDFRDLGVRHLGSVYEGLLEFKLQVADEYLRKATEDGKPVWKAVDDPSEADRKPGDLYLTNDKSERKATGSYYTPDYIVRYIVENTIGPQIDRIEHEYELAQKIKQKCSSGASPENSPGNKMGSSSVPAGAGDDWDVLLNEILADKPDDETKRLLELWQSCNTDSARREFLLNQLDGPQPDHGYDPPTRVLELKVLDPALGSGHFLVGALDYVTTRLAGMLNEYADSPVFERIREDRRKIVESLGKQDIEAQEEKLTDENLLRRMVMKRCLYGVDLNPLAVELSKLSLWLHAFTAGAPLSFLDHHVKCGNSLIGTSLDELDSRVEQAPGLFSLKMDSLERAVDHMLTVAELSDASFEDVQRSREEYWKADARVEAYRALLDSLTAEHFGVKDASHFIDYGMDIDLENFEESVEEFPDEDKERLAEARKVASERRFFHWNVEFPEVFFQRANGGVKPKENAGFDAVVGNPPYRAAVGKKEKSFFKEKYRSQKGDYDTYVFSIEKGLLLIKAGGVFGQIVPDTFTDMIKYRPLRQLIFSFGRFRCLGEAKDVFEDAIVENAIPIIECGKTVPNKSVKIDIFSQQGLKTKTYFCDERHWRESKDKIISYFVPKFVTDILNLIKRYTIPLKDIAEVRQGLTAYDRYAGQEEDVIRSRAYHSEERKNESFKPWIRGKDIKRYGIHWSGEYISYGSWLAAPRDPKIFKNSRLLIREVVHSSKLYVVHVDQELYYGHSVIPVIIKTLHSTQYILSICASRIMGYWACYNAANVLKSAFPKVNPDDVRNFPIRRIFFTTPEAERQSEVAELKDLYYEAVRE